MFSFDDVIMYWRWFGSVHMIISILNAHSKTVPRAMIFCSCYFMLDVTGWIRDKFNGLHANTHFWRTLSCSKTCLVGLLIRSIFRGKIARALQCECSFSSEKSSELTDQKDIFCFNHSYTFYTSTNIERKCWLIANSRDKTQPKILKEIHDIVL